MSIPLNPGRKPVSMIDAEETIKWFAEKKGKTVEEMRKIFKENSEQVFSEMRWQDMYEDSERLKDLCFVLAVTYQLAFILLMLFIA